MGKKIILIIIVTIGVGFAVYQGFVKKTEPTFVLEKVSRGQIFQEVSETGTVKASKEEINLGFKGIGKIEKVYVKVGDKVISGQSLAQLDSSQLIVQLAEAKAGLQVAQANLNKLLAGSSAEEIILAETAVANAQIAEQNVKQNLEDIKTQASTELEQAYEDALFVLDSAYLELYNAFNLASKIKRDYFIHFNQEGLQVAAKKNEIESAFNKVKPYIEAAKNNSPEEIDKALTETKSGLSVTFDALEVIQDTCDTPLYRDLVSTSDKNSLTTQRTKINTSYTNIINTQQTISFARLTNEININTGQAQVLEAEGALKTAQDELALEKAKPRQEDIDLYQAQIKQAEARVLLLEDQLQETTLKSPTDGQITKARRKTGEIVQSAESVISLIPASPFQIKVDIYEEDIIKLKVGNPAELVFAAFPDKVFKGRVVSIEPAEKLIEGVVYYEVTIDFEETREEIKPGMTVDVMIKTASREDVLIIPEEALKKKNDKIVTRVFKDAEIQEREIEIGLKSSDDKVEVISGLEEGEEVILNHQ